MLLEYTVDKGNQGIGWSINGQFRITSDEILYWLGRPLVDLCARMMFNMDVSWHAPLPEGPKIIAPNHPSTTDPFLVTMLASEKVSILIDDRLFKVPLFGRYLRQAGHVPVVPGQGRIAYEAARRLLEEGRTVAIFPEGHISPLEGGFCPPRTGVARLALSTGASVVPVGIHLQRDRIRLAETEIEGQAAVGTWYLSGPYAITVGRAMRFEGDVEDRPYVRAISQQIIQRIARLAGESEQRTERKSQDVLRAKRVPNPAGLSLQRGL